MSLQDRDSQRQLILDQFTRQAALHGSLPHPELTDGRLGRGGPDVGKTKRPPLAVARNEYLRRLRFMSAHDSPQPRTSASEPSPALAHDGNLDLPVDDPAWREFLDCHAIHAAAYDDMAKLTVDLKQSVKACAYLPAANYFYLRDDPSYQPVASALYAADQTPRLSSLLVVTKSSGITTLDQLRSSRLGYAHRYCTTSYFAPALVLLDSHDAIADFFAALIQVPPYQGQIDCVVAGRVDATMVQEDVWRKTPANAEATRVIARRDNLPTPLVIVGANTAGEFKKDLRQLLFSHRPQITPTTLFSGFVPYQSQQVEEFFAASARALPALTN
jgi:phosphonate transport system substrate-binding protein